MSDGGIRVAPVGSERSILAVIADACDDGGPERRTTWIVGIEIVLMLAACVAGVVMFYFWDHPMNRRLLDEHGPIEMLHLTLLAAGIVVSYFAAKVSRGVTRTISNMFLIVTVTGLIREIELKSLRGPRWWNELTDNYSLQEVMLISGAIVLAIYMLRRRHDLPAVIRRSFNIYAMPLHISAIALFCGAYAFEKIIPDAAYSLVAEEILETIGYLFLLVAILRTLDKARSEREMQTPWPSRAAIDKTNST